MKKLIYLLLCAATLMWLAGCTENDPTDDPVPCYSLDQFISADSVRAYVDATADLTDDFRALFAYEIVSGADGFSPRASINAGYDLDWETFSAGYLVPSDDGSTYFPGAGLPGAFRVDDTGLFRLYRKVEVDSGAKGTKTVELRGLSLYPTTNWISETENAIKLSDLVQGIAAYDSVSFVAVDGYAKTYIPDQINDGYYLLTSEVTTFPTFNASMSNSLKKFKKLCQVIVYGATTPQNFDFELALEDTADLTFEVPVDLSGLESTELILE